MDNEQARFLLSAAHPSGRDADRPEIAEALDHAQRDPELAAWLARERAADLAIMRKLRELEPDPALRARLLAGGRASRRRSRVHRAWRVTLAWAAVAVVVLGAGSWFAMHPRRDVEPAGTQSRPAPLLAWQRDAVAIFSAPDFRLDMQDTRYPPLEKFLAAHGLPVADEPPFTGGIASAVGCKVLDWRGTRVSLACFLSDTGELVHLFVRRRDGLDTAQLGGSALRMQVGDYATATWLQGDRIIMVASRLPAEALERMLARDPVALATHPRRSSPI